MDISKDLIAASATPLILAILSEGENYGYAIIKRVKELSDGRMQWTDGMLYPVLHRLETQKLIESDTAGNGDKHIDALILRLEELTGVQVRTK